MKLLRLLTALMLFFGLCHIVAVSTLNLTRSAHILLSHLTLFEKFYVNISRVFFRLLKMTFTGNRCLSKRFKESNMETNVKERIIERFNATETGNK